MKSEGPLSCPSPSSAESSRPRSSERLRVPSAQKIDTIHRLLAASIDLLNDAILLTEGETTKGPDGLRRILFVNESYVRMTGFSHEEAIGQTPGITIGPASDRAVLKELEEARAALRPIRVEIQKYRKDGSTFWTELDVVPIFDENGNNSHFLGVLRDITERKLLQARLTEADRLASLGTLAAGIAHEINNPLSYVLMNLSHAVEQLRGMSIDGTREIQASLAEALQGAERVRRIIGDIKAFSRQQPTVATPTDVAAILDGALQLSRKDLALRARIVRDYQPARPVLGDATRLGQVFLNLLMNAAQALPDDAPMRHEVRLRIFEDTTVAGTFTRIEITDTGTGISPDVLPKIFDPFFTTKAIGEGTGLGLSICHGIVTGLGGTIEVESVWGRGTTVRVGFPVAEPVRRTSAFPAAGPTSARRLRVLIVDDEPTVANALRRVLARDHEVLALFSAEDALAHLAKCPAGTLPFDAVLCDLMMPGLSGMDLHAHLSEAVPKLAEKMVFMTGGAYTKRARAFVDTPGRITLDKPFDIGEISRLLSEIAASTQRA